MLSVVAERSSRKAVPHVDAVVIGAGVVGLGCAAALARGGRTVIVVERHDGPGRETSSRNSGVIHAGLYYPTGSLKARLCVEGRHQLYRWCAAKGIAHRKTGKLVVATTPDEVARLEPLLERGRANGAGALEWLDGEQVRRRDPVLCASAALWSPETGMVDVHALVDSLLAEARNNGADVAWHTRVTRLEGEAGGARVATVGPAGEHSEVRADVVVNACGLEADRMAALAGVDVDGHGWRQHPCKGQYFALAPKAPRPRSALVYPVPSGGGLGIHLTTDLGGRCIAGPDATYVRSIDYDVDPSRAVAFAESVSRYLPGIRPEHLTPDYAGIRPKLAAPGEGFRDFVVQADPPGIVHLLGIESPGLTASLALANHVTKLTG